ncbi:tRNA pseudouridine(54/55) synthase Pus10 [Haloarchaeobius sp. HRN-SO-5]|uniref:tRNA pseudouridine(54/55) synthase Pus10 n=1 Tax=Haloarchaeobius sp. HRN-SO-5 TaxID=3446118 RepID=UPI003EB8CFEE
MVDFETVRALRSTGPVCDACLGRPFADRSFGLTNEERGKGLRVALALADDEPYESVDPAECWVCEGLCNQYDTYAELVAEQLSDVDFETYQVGTRVPPLVEENDRLLREDAGLDPDAGELFKSEFNREVGKRVGRLTGAEVDFGRPDVLALLNVDAADREPSSHAVEVQINPAFVYGRYRKLERDIPQTEWPCRECGGSGVQLGDDGEEPCDHCGGSGYLYEMSVEQYVAPHVLAAMDGDEALFHGAGREDVDALMLGPGRPFVVEVKRPRRRSPDVAALEERVNDEAGGAVEVEGLRLATHEMVERVKELDASKTYRATVEFDEPVTEAALADAVADLDGATIRQHTPHRVDHRRAKLDRERTVYDIDATLEDERHATVEVHGEGGLYIKELVSSDEGRTEPSLAGLLGVGAVVTALDVLDVRGEDEPFDDPAYLR